MLTTIIIAAAEDNPFLNPFNGAHGTAPFSEIKIEHFEPAFDRAIAEHKSEIDAIAANTALPTFENTIIALENAGELLNRVGGVFFNLLSAESNDKILKRMLWQEYSCFLIFLRLVCQPPSIMFSPAVMLQFITATNVRK